MITMQEFPDHLRVVAECKYSLDGSLRVFGEALTLAARAGRNAALVDARAVSGPVPTLADRYEWGVHIADLQARQSPRVRFALLGHDPFVQLQRFEEIVAANRGGIARSFTEESEALEWLLVLPRKTLRIPAPRPVDHRAPRARDKENDDDAD
jgi:hypothetical protein